MPVNAAIAALAHRQRGYVTRWQLLRLGLSRAAIARRLRSGYLLQVYAGVYAVGHHPVAFVDRAAAAILACGPHAALSHGSAAALWGFTRNWREPFEVTAPSGHERDGILTHRSTSLAPQDVTRHFGLRVTSPARTLLDHAPRVTERSLVRIANDARLARLLTPLQLSDVIERFPRHRGASRLRPLAEAAGRPTRSVFEDDFARFCAEFGLPTPEVNASVCGYEVDAWFEPERLVVQLDGWDFHRTRSAFETDRDRDAELLAVGVATMRITKRRIAAAQRQEARRLARILAARRAGGAPPESALSTGDQDDR